MADESIHTNAQNFPSFASGGVDPRTGLYTFALLLPSVTAGDLAGPEFSLALNFNPIGGDNWALGSGWSTNLSHVQLNEPRMLKLSTGEQFKIDGSGPEPAITERKLPSFRYLQHSQKSAQIIHRSGAVEHLSHPGVGDYLMPHMLQGPTGHTLHLTYESDEGRPRLATVRDDSDQVLLELIKIGASLIQIVTPSGTFALHFDNDRLRRLELPEEVGGEWEFKYTADGVPYANITQVTQPLGGVERIAYDTYHLVPGNGMPDIPRVSRHEVDAGPGSTLVLNEYRYGDDNHNFLGFGGISDWQSDGIDNLYRSSATYTYSVTHVQKNADQARTTTRVYNSFHLLVSETTQQGPCIVERQTEYHLMRGAPFHAQPPQFQLPKTITTRWRLEGQAVARSETTTTEFDAHGNLTYQLRPNGQETRYTYYPAQGETDTEGVACPADPWGFVRHYRTITERPARKQGDSWFDDLTVTTYRHGRIDCLSAAPGKPMSEGYAIQAADIHTQSTRSGQTAHQQQVIEYYHSPVGEARHQHGRVKCRHETLWLSQTPNERATSVEHHAYEKIKPTAKRPLGSHLRTTVRHKAHDGCENSAVREQDLASGLTLTSRDNENTEVAYTHDALQRLLSARIQDPDVPAVRTFTYHHSGASGLAEAEQTSATGVTSRRVYDRLGREIERYRDEGWQQASSRVHEGLYWRGTYDGFGRLVTETEYDDCGPEAAVLQLTTTYEYDDWGQVRTTLLPDGTRQISETSPFGKAGPVITRWRESAPSSEDERSCQGSVRTELGVFGTPVRVEVMLADGSVEQRTDYTYDGWGQCIEQSDQFRLGATLGEPQRTRMSYDPWGRVWQTTQPNGDVFLQGFIAHSRAALVTQLQYVPAGGPATPQLLAERRFDGLGRVAEQTQGGRTLRYVYEGASASPSQVHQADGNVIHYTYKPALTASPLTAKSGGMYYRYGYDLTSGRLLSAEPTDPQGQSLTQGPMAITNTYRYSNTGQLLEDIRTDQGQAYTTGYQESFAGRRIKRSDQGAGASVYRYDSVGRLCEQHALPEQGAVLETVTLGYDAFGQVNRRKCGELITEIRYDSLGRDIERRTVRNGGVLRRCTHEFNGNGYLARRLTFDSSDRQVLCETFDYDARNRLVMQANEGLADHLPRDSFGLALASQVFEFDALDNLTLVLSIYASGEMRTTTAYFDGPDSCQLSRLVHTFMAQDKTIKTVDEESFTYDANGRLEARSTGWQLSYDTFGRLASLHQPGGGQRSYRYDPQGSLCAVHEDSSEQQRFYDGLAINHLRRKGQVHRYLTAAGTPLALLQEGAGATVELVTDRNGSVTGEWRENALHAAVYDAYGNSQGAAPLSGELGFNGELREGPGSDLYLLGRGYRLYDAALMRFLAPDSASPFDEGGLNPYAYCRGNPVMFYDPTGHMPQWTASNLPYYVPPPEMQQEQAGGGLFGRIMKAVGWAFIAWEALSLIRLTAAVVTVIATGGMAVIGAAAAGIAAAGIATAALGVGVASMLDEDNQVLMYFAIGVGVVSTQVTRMAGNMMRSARAAKAGAALAPAGDIGAAVPESVASGSSIGDAEAILENLANPNGPITSGSRRSSVGSIGHATPASAFAGPSSPVTVPPEPPSTFAVKRKTPPPVPPKPRKTPPPVPPKPRKTPHSGSSRTVQVREDAWESENGQAVRHGTSISNPAAAAVRLGNSLVKGWTTPDII